MKFHSGCIEILAVVAMAMSVALNGQAVTPKVTIGSGPSTRVLPHQPTGAPRLLLTNRAYSTSAADLTAYHEARATRLFAGAHGERELIFELTGAFDIEGGVIVSGLDTGVLKTIHYTPFPENAPYYVTEAGNYQNFETQVYTQWGHFFNREVDRAEFQGSTAGMDVAKTRFYRSSTGGIMTITSDISNQRVVTSALQQLTPAGGFPSGLPGSFTSAEAAEALRLLSAGRLTVRRLEYKWKVPVSTVPQSLYWMETFTPAINPNQVRYHFLSETIPAGQTETPPHLIDPLENGNPARYPNEDGRYEVIALDLELAVDANRDGTIKLASEDASDNTTPSKPYRFWINDDDNIGIFGPSPTNYLNDHVDGVADLKDFVPVFLDIQELVKALPAGPSVSYKIKQADGAVNFVYTDKTRDRAFAYHDAFSSGWGTAFSEAVGEATTIPVTAAGVELTQGFLNNIQAGNKGVILIEGRGLTTAPLVLSVERNGVVVAEASLPLSIKPRILLLLHGMNSNTATWSTFTAVRHLAFQDIREGDFESLSDPPPRINPGGARCYRLQFGTFETLTTARTGLEGVRASNSKGGINGVNKDYLTEPLLKCGDFETFSELAQELDEAIDVLLDRHPGAEIVLVGHSRGGMIGRKFLQGPSSSRKSAVVGLLTTSSPHQGSRLARVYEWLYNHPRDAVGSFEDDWEAVDFLLKPQVVVLDKPTLDVRRPVIMDIADISSLSTAIRDLNDPAEVSKLPATIMYGEIINSRVKLGVMNLGTPSYSVFDEGGTDAFDQLSSTTETEILGTGKVPADYPGDGLVPGSSQVFTQLPGFPAPGYPPAPPPATGQNTILRLLVNGRDIVHTGAPLQSNDIYLRLQLIAPGWFP